MNDDLQSRIDDAQRRIDNLPDGECVEVDIDVIPHLKTKRAAESEPTYVWHLRHGFDDESCTLITSDGAEDRFRPVIMATYRPDDKSVYGAYTKRIDTFNIFEILRQISLVGKPGKHIVKTGGRCRGRKDLSVEFDKSVVFEFHGKDAV